MTTNIHGGKVIMLFDDTDEISQKIMIILDILQLITGVFLTITILLQAKGEGLGSAIGGGSGNVVSTRRGAEKGIFTLSVILSAIFIGLCASRIFIS